MDIATALLAAKLTGVPKPAAGDNGKALLANSNGGYTLTDLGPGISYEVVSELPSTGEAGVIYLVENGGTGTNVYDEYIWTGSGYEKIGTTDIDSARLLPPYTSSDNKKILKIEDGSAVFVDNDFPVELSKSGSTWSTNKTYNEINAAVASGKNVHLKTSGANVTTDSSIKIFTMDLPLVGKNDMYGFVFGGAYRSTKKTVFVTAVVSVSRTQVFSETGLTIDDCDASLATRIPFIVAYDINANNVTCNQTFSDIQNYYNRYLSAYPILVLYRDRVLGISTLAEITSIDASQIVSREIRVEDNSTTASCKYKQINHTSSESISIITISSSYLPQPLVGGRIPISRVDSDYTFEWELTTYPYYILRNEPCSGGDFGVYGYQQQTAIGDPAEGGVMIAPPATIFSAPAADLITLFSTMESLADSEGVGRTVAKTYPNSTAAAELLALTPILSLIDPFLKIEDSGYSARCTNVDMRKRTVDPGEETEHEEYYIAGATYRFKKIVDAGSGNFTIYNHEVSAEPGAIIFETVKQSADPLSLS